MRSLCSFLQIDALRLRFKSRNTRGLSFELIPDIFKNRQVFMVFLIRCVGRWFGQFSCNLFIRLCKLMSYKQRSKAATEKRRLRRAYLKSPRIVEFSWFSREMCGSVTQPGFMRSVRSFLQTDECQICFESRNSKTTSLESILNIVRNHLSCFFREHVWVNILVSIDPVA